ncbi:hypothetical protein [Streptomyces endophyticus]|uniref:Uncharacterized protein n=1 Tax=Streptomyces endophyticus TaxID=714166 RepID=A0ABU6F6Q4_9ACTN|nr:hypothetical protein [Streptomyces endophyticus]MEB8339514.1 hypothetical protein [Streptomyces endophyticus]
MPDDPSAGAPRLEGNRCVCDPAVPEHDRRLIDMLPVDRFPPDTPSPDAVPAWRPPNRAVALSNSVRSAGGWAVLSAGLGWLVSLCFGSSFWLPVLIGVLLALGATVTFGLAVFEISAGAHGDRVRHAQSRKDLGGWKAALRQHGRYVLPQRLAAQDGVLLDRARVAVASVLESRAHTAGVIDSVRNRVELPAQLWRIAQDLRTIGEGEADATLAGRAAVSREGRAVVARRYEELEQARAAVTARVRGLENYARAVERLDAQLAENQALERLGGSAGVLDLIARIDVPGADAEDLTDMEAHARAALESTLKAAQDAATWLR